MRKKLFLVILSFALIFSLAIGSGSAFDEVEAAEETTKNETETDAEIENDETVDIQIFATSDMHGKFLEYDYALDQESSSGSVAQVKTAVGTLRTDNTIVVDAGDTIQDNYADLFIDDDIHLMTLAMNEVGYDITVA